MVAVAEEQADLLEGQLGVLSQKVHPDVARLGDLLGSALTGDRRQRHAVVLRDGLQNCLRIGGRGGSRCQGGQRLLRDLEVDRAACQASVGDDAVKAALQRADVVPDAVREIAQHLGRHVDPPFTGLRHQDGEARLFVR